jgi:uncharacterized repeat protein (TIGR01451 family)
MFKKLVTNLPYSPGLLNQIGFYSKRLRQEEFTRRLGVVFAVLALLLNANLVFYGPEASVLASPANDVIVGGIYGSSATAMQDKAIAAMKGSSATAAIFDYYGITEADIRATSISTINTANESYRSVGRQSFGRGGETCRTHNGQYFCERSMYAAYSYKNLNVKALTGVRQSKTGVSDRWFSLIESCGNVVIRTGNDEDIKVEKDLAPTQTTKVKTGENAVYRIKISSLNENGAKKPVITDTMPKYTTYVNHSPKDLFDKVSVSGQKVTLSSTKGELGPNETRVIDFTVKVSASAPDGTELCNIVSAASLEDTAVATEEPCITVNNPPPAPAEPNCVALRLISGSSTDKKRSFEAEVKSDGATVEQYVFNFGDGESATVVSNKSKVSTEHTYQSAGEYKAKVLVKTSAGDVGNRGTCVKKVTVDEETSNPVVSCDFLNLLSRDGDKFKFQASGSAEDTSIASFVFEFGDGNTSEVANDGSNKATAEYTYTTQGSFVVKAYAIDADGNRVGSKSCCVDIEIETPACPYDETLKLNDENCKKPVIDDGIPNIILRKEASNTTQGIDNAHNTKANAGDIIEYRLITENDGDATEKDYKIMETLGDVLQYANIVDFGGGSLDEDSQIISWPAVDIEAGQVLTKTITVKIKSPIPATPISASDSLAYDLRLENAYGNNVTIELPASTPKQVELLTKELPNTGPGLNAALSTIFFGAVAYFYTRNRLISKELAMIKAEFSGGSPA